MREAEEQNTDEGDGTSVAAEGSSREISTNHSPIDPFETFIDRLFPRLGILFAATLVVVISPMIQPLSDGGELALLVFLSAFASLFYSTMLVYLLALFDQAIFRGLEVGLKKIAIGAIAGGSVGLFLLGVGSLRQDRIGVLLLFLLIMTTILGQLGGAVGTWKAIVECRLQGKELEGQRKKFQFSIRQLLIVTTCCAVLLACMKFAGMFTVSFGIFLSLWFFVQCLGYLVARSVGGKMQVKAAANRST